MKATARLSGAAGSEATSSGWLDGREARGWLGQRVEVGAFVVEAERSIEPEPGASLIGLEITGAKGIRLKTTMAASGSQ